MKVLSVNRVLRFRFIDLAGLYFLVVRSREVTMLTYNIATGALNSR